MSISRGRFAPSPSGRMHLGNVFCALISWLSIKSEGGQALLRIEDLDTSRCKPAYAEQLLDDLKFLGLEYDFGPTASNMDMTYFQSARTALYERALETLKSKGFVYPCYCSRDELHAASAPHTSDGRVLYNGACRSLSEEDRVLKTRNPAMRMKAADRTYAFIDGLYGEQRSNVQKEWGDFVLRRSDGLFSYQLAVVVDDAAMGITQVVRGRDLLSSVAPQLQLYEALDLQAPRFIHIPLLLNEGGRRLSKRDRDLDMGEIRKRYSSPEPIIGKLLFLAGVIDRDEPVSAKEASKIFSIDKLCCHDIVLKSNNFV